MNRLKGKPWLMMALVGALVALLPMLAVLQYRWLGEVSRAERERMQASLKIAAAGFTRDFDGELTRAYMTFQMDARTVRARDWQSYSRQYDQWSQNAPHPQLADSVYLVEPDDGGRLRISRFDRASSSFAPVAWPAALDRVKSSLEEAVNAEHTPGGIVYRSSYDMIDDQAPALVIPIPDVDLTRTDEPKPPLWFVGHLVVTLNMDYIRGQLIPELAARYFTTGTGLRRTPGTAEQSAADSSAEPLDYRVAITRRGDPANVIYQTDGTAASGIAAAADATEPLFGLRLDTPAVVEGVAREIDASHSQQNSNRHVSLRFFNLAVKTDDLTVKIDKNAGPKAARSSEETVPRIAMLNREGGGRWQLALQHRAGSLDAAVASTRRRNLGISFGILLLLSVSIAMIVVSTRRAERLARQQMEFVAGVSHEMRTPLAVICSAGENLADGVIEQGEQVKQYGALIESEGRRLSEMIEQALEFAGIQSGRKSYALQPSSVAATIEAALAACDPLISEESFVVERAIADGLPMIAADVPALSRAIQNLLSNAIKYCGKDRWIRVSAATIEGASAVRITVEDHGLGIAAPDLPHIFEPFYRTADVTAAQIHGSGLGLSLVKYIVEAHGGTVTAVSTPGKGSAFTLRLPALAETEPLRDANIPLAARQSGEV